MDKAEAVLTWRDLAAASRRRAVRSRVWALIVPLCVGFTALAVTAPGLASRLIALFLLGYVGSIPFWGPTAATWMQARRRTWPDHPTAWVPTEDGLAVESAAGTSKLPWTALSEASSWRRGVSLRYGRAVAFIPRRAFRGAGHQEEFVTALQGHLAGARTP